MSELDKALGPRIDDSDDRWQKAAVSNPAAWRDPNNPITERVIQQLAYDQGADYRDLGAARARYRNVAIDLILSAKGDIDWLLAAMDQCRVKGRERWMDLNLYQQKAGIITELPRVRHATPVADKWGLCPLCHQLPCRCDDDEEFK